MWREGLLRQSCVQNDFCLAVNIQAPSNCLVFVEMDWEDSPFNLARIRPLRVPILST